MLARILFYAIYYLAYFFRCVRPNMDGQVLWSAVKVIMENNNTRRIPWASVMSRTLYGKYHERVENMGQFWEPRTRGRSGAQSMDRQVKKWVPTRERDPMSEAELRKERTHFIVRIFEISQLEHVTVRKFMQVALNLGQMWPLMKANSYPEFVTELCTQQPFRHVPKTGARSFTVPGTDDVAVYSCYLHVCVLWCDESK